MRHVVQPLRRRSRPGAFGRRAAARAGGRDGAQAGARSRSRRLPGLAGLVPLRAGASYAVDSASLALALAAGASQAGEWVGFAGCADFGAEAAAELGIELSRTVLVPDPGEHWLEVTAALVDVLRVVVLRPPAVGRRADAGILDSRLRKRSAVLVVHGDWPRFEARLSVEESAWTRSDVRHGQLRERRARVAVRRGARPPQRADLTWPGSASASDRQVREVRASVRVSAPDEGDGRLVPRLVGGRRAGEAEQVAALPRRRAVAPTSSRSATAPPGPRAYAAGSAAATPRRAAPSCVLLRRQPRPRRPRLRAGAGRRSRSCARGWPRCARACSRSGRPALVRRRDRRRRDGAAEPWSRPGVWDVPGRGRRRPVHRRAGRPARRRAGVRWSSRRAAPRPFLRGLPVDVLEDDGAAGRELVSLLQRLGLRTLGDLADLPGDAVEHRFGRVRRRGAPPGPRARTARCSRPRTPPPELDGEVAFEPPLDSVEAISFSVRTTAERFVAELAAPPARRHRGAGRGRVARASSASSRAWLHPRYFTAARPGRPGALAAAVGRGRWRAARPQDSGEVPAPVDRVRFVPEVVEPAAAHGEALWGGADERVERGVARVQGMLGFDAVRRPVLQGGRSPADRQALVPWGERAVGLRPVDRPWPGRVPGPAPARVFADAARRRGRRRRPVATCASPTAASSRGEPHALPARRRRPAWQPVTAWAGPWPVGRGLVVGRSRAGRPVPGGRRRRPGLAADCAHRTAGALEAGYD